MFVWEWDENLANSVLVVVIKFAGCAMGVAFAMEMIDALPAAEEDGTIATTAVDKDQHSVHLAKGNSNFWFTSTSPLNGPTIVMLMWLNSQVDFRFLT